jgi:hypothetical protein
VVETIFLDWGLALGTGLLFGLAGRREVASAPRLFATRAFRWGLAYLHVGVIAVSATLYALNPDWMWMYWVPARELPIAVAILAFVMYEVAFVAGFALAAGLERWRAHSGWALAGLLFGLITAAEATTRVRLFHFGTLEEFLSGRAPLGIDLSPFRLEPEMWVVLVPGCIAAFAAGYLVWRLARADAARFQASTLTSASRVGSGSR